MKKLILAGIVLLWTISSQAQFIKAELEVSGLTCSMCSLSTQKSLKTLDFIENINPDLNKNIFYISFRNDKPVSPDAIKDKVKAAGFSVSKLILVFNFSGKETSTSGTIERFENAGDSYQFFSPKNSLLKGETRFRILDKDFMSSKELKKINLPSLDNNVNTLKSSKKQRIYLISLS